MDAWQREECVCDEKKRQWCNNEHRHKKLHLQLNGGAFTVKATCYKKIILLDIRCHLSKQVRAQWIITTRAVVFQLATDTMSSFLFLNQPC